MDRELNSSDSLNGALLTLRGGEHCSGFGLAAPAVRLQVGGVQGLLRIVFAQEDGLEAYIEKLVAVGGLDEPGSRAAFDLKEQGVHIVVTMLLASRLHTYITKGHVDGAAGSELASAILAAGGRLYKLEHALEVRRVRIVQCGHIVGCEVDLHIAARRGVLDRQVGLIGGVADAAAMQQNGVRIGTLKDL